jgi:hypothetical protein
MVWPLPLALGVATLSGIPDRRVTFPDSTSALSAKAVPVSRWHQMQWQQCTINGVASMRNRTAPQVHPPS